MNLEQLLERMRENPMFMENVADWEVIPAREGVYAPWPAGVKQPLVDALKSRGIERPYIHQAKAIEHVLKGEDVVVVTPTASGKTLCYNVPVIGEILDNPSARALYLFPTKALARDQVAEMNELIDAMGADVKAYAYDGDTPGTARSAIRQAGHVVVTNPDMLHSGILPHHTRWVKLFENLRYIVIDETHTYRGVFGSHLANVLRRLNRICRFYGARPTYICCSATIDNPVELTASLIGRRPALVDENGAPSGEKHVIFYNPPVVNRQLGIRKSSLLETRKIAAGFLRNGISTIVFARARLTVEVLVNYLKDLVRDDLGRAEAVQGYRGGYLPTQRRRIEQGLRKGEILGVVSTNALELGIDVGQLEACVISGYPGTIASTWQQAGRAGRRSGASVMVLVANSGPIDQYIMKNPHYLLDKPAESGLVNPDNLYILISHIKCAAFELPFEKGERYGGEDIEEILNYLEEQGILRRVGDTWHWMSEEFPASDVSLRSATNENFVIVDTTRPGVPRVMGEMDRYSVPMLLHEKAIYMHQGDQYQVEKLDFPAKKAFVKKVEVDYYTDADLSVNLRVLDVFREDGGAVSRTSGEVSVTSRVSMFKKIKLDTHENLGFGPVELPEMILHTTAYWAAVEETLLSGMSREEAQAGMLGVSNLLAHVAPLYLMCDPKDISVVYQAKSPFTHKPTLFIYDAYPGGVGFSDKLYAMHLELFRQCLRMVEGCSCQAGCPSCVGALSEGGKAAAVRILEGMLRDS